MELAVITRKHHGGSNLGPFDPKLNCTPPRVFQKIYLIEFANNVSKGQQYKDYCLIFNENVSWKGTSNLGDFFFQF